MRTVGLLLSALVLATLTARGDDLRPQVDPELPALIAIYKDLHAHPELSRHEERTSAFLARELRKTGFSVTEHVGKYPDGAAAFGVVAVLKNGSGPVVLVRTELDALPVEEKTGLPYASQVRTKNDAGQEVGVMHACGHDLHMTSLLGTARMLVKLKDRWSGTLILIGQPAEETIGGAKAMLADGLYTRFPKPDLAIALHDTNDLEAGKVGVAGGPVLASATSVTVTMRGMGGHGARPETTKDPVVMAAQLVLALQTIVSRQIAPQDPAVLTVGSIHGGSKNNIIPDEVVLQISTRSYRDEVRSTILAGIERTARGVALAAGVPEDRAPIVEASETEYTPVTYNDPKLALRVKGALTTALGDKNVVEQKPEMVSEDFGLFGLEGRRIPITMFRLGAADPRQLAESVRTGKPMPSLHSSIYYPQYEPAIRTGVVAMTSVVLDLMKK
ncbi:MAG TPA: amidohydrolase [Bryobacteraceae bacterium]|nr:amidohydrolase [Bryobacteraceae bacterium]